MAPINRGAQGLLAGWQRARPPAQQLQPTAQALQQRLRRQQPHPCGRQLDRQRQTVQTLADRTHRAGIGLGQAELPPGRLRALDKQPHRLDLQHLVVRGQGVQVRQGQGRDQEDVLAIDRDHHPARDEHLQSRSRLEQRGDQGRGPHHLLEVIQDEQQLLVAEIALQRDEERLATQIGLPKRLGDSAGHQVRIANWSQVDEDGPVGEGGHKVSGDL